MGRARQLAAGKRLDRLDAESAEFHRRVIDYYLAVRGRRGATFGWVPAAGPALAGGVGPKSAGAGQGTSRCNIRIESAQSRAAAVRRRIQGYSAGAEVVMKQRWGLIGVVAVISFLSGGWLLQRGVASGGNVYQQARLFDDVLGHVSAYYVDSIGETELYDQATRGMLEQLKDPYSVLLTGDDYKSLTEQTSGQLRRPRHPDRRARRLDHRRRAAAGNAGRAGRHADRRPDHRGGRQVHRRLEERPGGEGAPRRRRQQDHDHRAPVRRSPIRSRIT